MTGDVSNFLNSPGFGDVVRTLILMVGFGLSLACVKFAWLAYKGKEAWRTWGLLSYALLVITPALSGLYRYGEPLRWITTVTYVGALLCGVMAFRTFYVLAPEWIRLRHDAKAGR